MNTNQGKNVLVTGAGGFIGKVLCKRLVDEKFNVTGLAMPGEKTENLEQMGVSIVRGDLTIPETIRGICKGIDTVYHLAARVTYWGTRREFYDTIYDATKNILEEAAGKVHRFVYVSSVVATGLGPKHRKGLRENDPVYKTGIFYGDAKLDAEGLIWNYHRDGKISGTVIRPTNVIGPASVWVRDAVDNLNKPFLPLIDGGRWSASLVYVENLVAAFLLAGTKDIAAGQTYHIRDDYAVTWRQYFIDIAGLMGKKIKATTFISFPFALAWPVAGFVGALCAVLRFKTTFTRHNVGMMGRDNDIDNSKAKRELGWSTRVKYEDALQRIGLWMKKEGLMP
ncbi:udp-glucose 4-epimerase [hydrocarbon metagenome]|uniref:Udp-glucose 4-epimerase n=1 Tax=hydrocarbon metagenome TaxID=938273 RepID=A0A0W8FV00_9ZZZZ